MYSGGGGVTSACSGFGFGCASLLGAEVAFLSGYFPFCFGSVFSLGVSGPLSGSGLFTTADRSCEDEELDSASLASWEPRLALDELFFVVLLRFFMAKPDISIL